MASGDPVTFFAAMVNQGAGDAVNCRIEIAETGPFTYTYRAFDPATSSFTADPNTPVDIAGGGTQVFVLGFEFSGTMDRTSFEPAYVCDNGEALPVHALTNITLTASATPQPDILALASTHEPGVLRGFGNSVFAIAITNLNGQNGVGVPIEIVGDTMGRTIFTRLQICEIDDQARCIGPRADRLATTLTGGESRSFAIWAGGTYSYSWRFFDISRLRALILDPGSEEVLGSTSVAFVNGAYGPACSGNVPSVPWTGTIRWQTAIPGTGEIDASRTDDLNFYGDGTGNVFAVPIDAVGVRYFGTAGQMTFNADDPCYDVIAPEFSLWPVGTIAEPVVDGLEWHGRVTWNFYRITGRADVSPDDIVLQNDLRAVGTMTHNHFYPISPGVQLQIFPPEGHFIGTYSAFEMVADGRPISSGTINLGGETIGGELTLTGVNDSQPTCTFSGIHQPIDVVEIPNVTLQYANNRRIVVDVSNCSSSSDALEGQYHGVMIYQPMTVAGAPDENGLEVILAPSDPEQEQHMLWFLLRQ